MPVDGDESNKRAPASREPKWILCGGSGNYLIGSFNGRQFKSQAGQVRFHYGNCFCASQTFSNIPQKDARRIYMAWGRMVQKLPNKVPLMQRFK